MTVISKFKKKFYFVAAGYFKFFTNFSLKRWHPRIIIVSGSAGELIAVAAVVAATVVVDMISDRLKEIAEEKKKPMIDIIFKED